MVALKQIFFPLPSLALLIYGHSQGGNYINYAQVFTNTQPAFNLLSGTPSFLFFFLFLSFVDQGAELVEEGPEGGYLRPQLYQPIKTRHLSHFLPLLLDKKDRAAIHFHSTGCRVA